MAKRNKAAAGGGAAAQSAPAANAAWPLYALAAFLGLLLFFRPLVDGIVFAHYNNYFVWGAALFAALWGGRALLRGEGPKVGLAGWLLFLFVLFAALTARFSISIDETNHALPIWASYTLLYVAARNLCRDARARSMCLAFFGAGLAAECLFSLFHLAHILPMMRMEVNSNPGAVASSFGAAAVTEDIRHRLESNRAFGSFMFPNALAAYVVLGIPWGIAGTLTAWPALKTAMARKPFGEKPVMTPIPAALVYMILPALAAMILYQVALFLITYVETSATSRGSLLANAGVQMMLLYFMPLAVAGAPAALVWRFGFAGAGLILRAALFPVLALLCAAVLWCTASRGGFLGAGAALGLWGLVSLGRSRIPAAWMRGTAALAAVLVMAPIFLAHGQEPPEQAIAIEGRSTTIADLANVSTMQLRLHYWKVGAAMAADHLGTGVGLGNFANAYPYYRYQGAPFVQMAHNDFLQAFAETGVAGGLLFAAFWLVFIAAGVARVASVEDRFARITAAGLFFGVVAFVFHQLVDFGFQNPSLGFTVFCLAGISAATLPGTEAAGPARRRPVLLAGLLCAAALTAGAASRMQMADAKVAELGPISANLEAAVTLLTAGTGPNAGNATFLPASSVTSLVYNSNELESMGYFARPADGQTRGDVSAYVRIPMAPVLPLDTAFIVEKPEQARLIGRAATQRWIERAAAADEAYPYRWRLAFDLFQMHEILANTAPDGPAKAAALAGCEHWARTFIKRNAFNGFAYYTLGKALWMRGEYAEAQTLGSGEGSFREALDALSRATQANPSEPELWGAYANYAYALCGMLEARGEQAKGRQFYSLAEESWRRQGELLWIHAKLYPPRQQERDRFAALIAWKNALQREVDDPIYWSLFGARLDDYAGLLEWLGRTADAAEYRRQADESRARAQAIETGTFGAPQTR